MGNRASDNRSFYISHEDLAEVMKGTYSRRHVERAIRELLASGWVVQARRGGSRRGGASRYLIRIPTTFVWPLLEKKSDEPEGEPEVHDTGVVHEPEGEPEVHDTGDHVHDTGDHVHDTGVVLVNQGVDQEIDHKVDSASEDQTGDETSREDTLQTMERYTITVPYLSAIKARKHGEVNRTAEQAVNLALQQEGHPPIDFAEEVLRVQLAEVPPFGDEFDPGSHTVAAGLDPNDPWNRPKDLPGPVS
jgi:hypothetical protein